MLDPNLLLDYLIKKKINFFSGVPDSLLKNFLACLEKNKKIKNIICANEGAAISLTIGNYLATKKIGVTYLQNSGLGNAINPLISIADKDVYSIPLLMIIGWRGSPNSDDEPQHMAKGKITQSLLKNLNINYVILKNKESFSEINKLINFSLKHKMPVAVLIKKNILKSVNSKIKTQEFSKSILRSKFIEELLNHISNKDKLISTTGYTSRELYKIRKDKKLKLGDDFYMIGGMGHSSSVSLGYSLAKKNKKVFCLDGDGSLLMHMGSLATLTKYGKKNIKYILLNNNTHESVGGQPTNSANIDFKMFSESLGFSSYMKISSLSNLKSDIKKFINKSGPNFLEVRIKSRSMNNLGRPKKFIEIKNKFMN
jgi:phosphonopyruvate decarboxylase